MRAANALSDEPRNEPRIAPTTGIGITAWPTMAPPAPPRTDAPFSPTVFRHSSAVISPHSHEAIDENDDAASAATFSGNPDFASDCKILTPLSCMTAASICEPFDFP